MDTTRSRPFVTVVTGGSPRRMGIDFGRAVRGILHELVEETIACYRNRYGKDAAAVRREAAERFLPPTRQAYPRHVAEMEAVADGAKIPFEDLFFIAADEELVELWLRSEHCSTAAVRTRRGPLLGHNEDYPPRYLGRLVIVEARPDDGPAFLALTYPFVLAGPACGLSDAGMAFAVDSLSFPPAHRGIGVPTVFTLRDLYRARSIGDVPQLARCPDGLMGYAITVVSAEEDVMAAVEVRPGGDIVTFAAGDSCVLPHTNHTLALSIDRSDERPSRSSYDRLAALRRLLPDRPQTAEGLRAALSSRRGGLLRPVGADDESCTVATAVLDPGRRTMDVAKRGPGGHDFRRYRLSDG